MFIPFIILLIKRILIWLRLGAWLFVLGLGIGEAAQGIAIPQMVSYQSATPDSTAPRGERVQLNAEALLRTVPASEVQFTSPSGLDYIFVTDRLESTPSGTTHWVAQLKNKGDDYRAIITFSQDSAFGNIHTPDGNFRLHMQDGQMRLIDVYAAQRRTPIFHSKPLVAPPPPVQPKSRNTAPNMQRIAQAATGGTTTIDLMVLYTDGLSTKLGADILQTRIEHLVALSNQAYLDSKVNIQLRVVYSGKVAVSDSANHHDLLRDITEGASPFTEVAKLRKDYGADLVTLLKQKYSSLQDNYCGLAWGLGYEGATMNPANAFSVVSVGDDIGGSNSFCSDYTLPHELGHNMGSAHERANADTPGAYPYSYGYGIQGRFGDIMSYINPTVGKFSNPAIICSAQNDPCGVSESDPNNGANNALSLNNTAPIVAAFTAPSNLDSTPDNLMFTHLTGVTLDTAIFSEQVTIEGISAPTPISISGGEYSINGSLFVSAPSQISNGQTVQIKLQSSKTSYGVSTALLTVGTVTRAFRVVSAPAQITNAPAIAAGFSYSMALRADGTVWAWGGNSDGVLGDGTRNNKLRPVQIAGLSNVVQVVASVYATLALKADGTVWGWGNNNYYQLGDLTNTIYAQPRQVAGLSNIKKIALGYFDAMALDQKGQVWHWGVFDGYRNQTPETVSGITNATAIAAGQNFRLVLLQDGTIRAWGDKAEPTPVANLSNITAIAAGESHSLALRADGTLWAWGDNFKGQLGNGTLTSSTIPVVVQNVQGNGPLAGITTIAAGLTHSMATLSDGSAVIWGDNTYTQLGDGTTDNKLRPVPLKLPRVTQLSGHAAHTLALQDDGIVWAFGANNTGNLGDGTTSRSDNPIAVNATTSQPYWWIGQNDQQPEAFNPDNNSAAPNTSVETQAFTVTGVNQSTPISILGGQYSINNSAYTTKSGSVTAGQSVKVRLTAPAITGASNSAWLTIGGITTIYNVTAQGVAPSNVTAEFQIVPGWNLLGNGLNAPIQVSALLSDANLVQTVWKWLPARRQWAFFSPSLQGQAYIDYITTKNYASLQTIDPGEGFWVNAKSPITINHSAPTVVTAAQLAVTIVKGWNLVAQGEEQQTPAKINQELGYVITTLWAWDSSNSKWYFYAPGLEKAGTLQSYVREKDYLDFISDSKKIYKWTGFWLYLQ